MRLFLAAAVMVSVFLITAAAVMDFGLQVRALLP